MLCDEQLSYTFYLMFNSLQGFSFKALLKLADSVQSTVHLCSSREEELFLHVWFSDIGILAGSW